MCDGRARQSKYRTLLRFVRFVVSRQTNFERSATRATRTKLFADPHFARIPAATHQRLVRQATNDTDTFVRVSLGDDCLVVSFNRRLRLWNNRQNPPRYTADFAASIKPGQKRLNSLLDRPDCESLHKLSPLVALTLAVL
jgi:hypothetical protein